MKGKCGVMVGVLLALCCSWASGEMVGYFKFDNIKGGQFSDDTGKGLLGTLGVPAGAGAPEVVAGPSGASADKAVKIPRGEGMIADDSTFMTLDIYAPRTIELWAKSPGFTFSETTAVMLSYGQDRGYRIYLTNAGNIVYSLTGVKDYDTGVVFPFDDKWHHLAVVDDLNANVIIVYLDGAEVYRTTDTADNNAADTNLLFIGRTGTTPNYIAFEGSLDRIRISNAALTLDQLDKDAASIKATNSNTIAYFSFDEGKVPYVSKGAETIQAITLKDYASGSAGAPEVVADSPSGAAGDFSLYFPDGAQCIVPDPNKVLDVGGPGKNWTVEAWVKYESRDSNNRVIIFYYGPGGVSFSLAGGEPRKVFVTTLRIADFSSTGATVPLGEWHHVACVHKNGESLSFFVDGVLIEEDTYTSSSRLADVNSLHIGAEPDGGMSFPGWLDRIRFSNTALTAEELDSKAKTPIFTAVGEWSIY